MMTFLMYDKNGSLPMSNPFMPRTSPSTAQHASADPGFHSGAGEERYGEYNERLIYQAAFQDLNQPKAEATYPDGQLSVSLLKHQRIALSWMLQKEKSCCCSGGSFLADDQSEYISHNKTAEALNLDDDEEENDANSFKKCKQDEDSCDHILIPAAGTSTRNIQPMRPQSGTLVVCASTMGQGAARKS
ncbi:helicase-like transcription factor CHR28 isoform X2 [Daucus carota subsp. sativus]|uniref:helicase-like transcription factor CHR28 isoform X2 n=1 Tax=Daucus carota subsp. sativus TaxID=79200 RepID=UPI0007EF2220|nr:PREDICTED: helicase-like transcription factor CHR28 isoform X2 [Daucus carota subsp. sativus]